MARPAEGGRVVTSASTNINTSTSARTYHNTSTYVCTVQHLVRAGTDLESCCRATTGKLITVAPGVRSS